MENAASLVSSLPLKPTPGTLRKLVVRLRALTLSLLPLEVSTESINSPTSRIITPQVIQTYIAAAGDLIDALPYCLLRARQDFVKQANSDAADYDENYGRAIACEVLARRIIHKAPSDKLVSVMSTRYKHRHSDGDIELSSALELAIDTHCTIFLSSSESQDVVNWLWKGEIVLEYHDDQIVPYNKELELSLFGHFDPVRISVPRYQNVFRIAIWLIFLVIYSQAVSSPLDPDKSALRTEFDEWEIALYILSLAFAIEEMHKNYKILRFATYRAFGFWNLVTFATDCLFITAFALRVAGIASAGDNGDRLRLLSFQVLSYAAPLICPLQQLLSVLGIGFLQGLFALDAADGFSQAPTEIVYVMVEALLGSPDFAKFRTTPAGMILYYLWNVATVVILLNVLISLFSSAYDDVVDDAEAEFLAYFAGKTIGMVRAPDVFVYPAPFNILETFLVAPFEPIMSPSAYAQYNKIILTAVLFVPLTIIAFLEVTVHRPQTWLNGLIGDGSLPFDEENDLPQTRDPEVDGEDRERGMMISKVPFTELVKQFPDTHESVETTILREIEELKKQIANLTGLLEKS
ncbi:calcium activated cation channel [Vararia minispora EC-137]|uniref:Calcium activated cation channel n=1 Tax=Vararia minispora EC-137 TaxID=1314806 RepID=A0ACB8QW27_9AGAM|nr:calcium activated cation channel [Vararia minispora EC-137]